MILWKRALMLGGLSWLIPLAISMPLFALKQANAPLFEAAMTLVVLLVAGVLLRSYFRERTLSIREGVLVGSIWLVMNLVLDYPMFAYGPMKMTAANYYSQIGVDYLIYPLFAFGAARLDRGGLRAEKRA